MRIKFLGTEDGPDETIVRGITFVKGGDPVNVTDEALAAGLAGNPQFEAVDGDSAEQDIPDDSDELKAELQKAFDYRERMEAFVTEVAALAGVEASSDLPTIETALRSALEGNDYKPNDSGEAETVLAEIKASEDWAKVAHPTRIRWANALSEDQIKTAAEADEVILEALVDDEDQS